MLVLANLESYNAVLISQEKTQSERMQLLRKLALQQLQTLNDTNVEKLSSLENSNLKSGQELMKCLEEKAKKGELMLDE